MTGTTPAAWNDPGRGAELAKGQFDRGVDVVYAAAGGTGLGVLQAAKDRGKLAIGVDSNQNHLHPGTMLTSMLKRVDVADLQQLQGGHGRQLEAAASRCWACKEGGVDWALDEDNEKLITPEMKAKVDAAKADIISGKIMVARLHEQQLRARTRSTADACAPSSCEASTSRSAPCTPCAACRWPIDARQHHRHRRRERRRQVDADEHPLRPLPRRCGRDPGRRQAGRHGEPARGHRARASAWSISTSCWSTRFTVLENLVLGAEGGAVAGGRPARRRGRSWRGWRATTASPSIPMRSVADLSVGEQQRVEILKVLFRGARILILDEPSAVLTPQETDQLFEILRALRERGVTIVLITHKLREIMARRPTR